MEALRKISMDLINHRIISLDYPHRMIIEREIFNTLKQILQKNINYYIGGVTPYHINKFKIYYRTNEVSEKIKTLFLEGIDIIDISRNMSSSDPYVQLDIKEAFNDLEWTLSLSNKLNNYIALLNEINNDTV
ncbi:hypothetical protein ACFSWD_27415 [Paenibacillus xanthanilyticus]